MRFYPGNTASFKYPVTGNNQVLILAARATTFIGGNGQPQVMHTEYEILKQDGTTGWFNEDCFN